MPNFMRDVKPGITDAELAAAAATEEYYPDGLWKRLEKSSNPVIADALQLLSELREYALRHAASELVSEIIRKTGILSIYAAVPQGKAKIGNLLKFRDLASAKTQSQSLSLFDFIRVIDTCIDESILWTGIERILAIDELRVENNITLLRVGLEVIQSLPVDEVVGTGDATGCSS
mgnify:CR=1 FL=1